MPSGYALSGRVAELAPLVMATAGTHAVQLYEDDAFLIEILARVVGEALESGDAVVTLATRHHQDALDERLALRRIDVGAARDLERYVTLDAETTVATLTADGEIGAEQFDATIVPALDRAARATVGGRVRAFGELVSLLWMRSRRDTALALEALWEKEQARRRGFSLLCAYPLTAFGSADDTPRFDAMCRHHTHVAPAESYATLDSAGARLRAIAALQQKALVLEGVTVRGTGDIVAVACKHCRRTLLEVSRIGSGEADVLATHLRTEHPGVLGDAPPMLGEILRQMLVDAR
jgi:hypothetical protein